MTPKSVRLFPSLAIALLSSLVLASTGTLSGASETAGANQDVVRTGLDRDLIYFVMPDRYRNGDTSNDKGPGYDPTHTAFFHGGDLKGLTGNCRDDDGLARLKRLGFTAIWLTPLVVQQPPTQGGAGYHGYWGVDFLNVEPRLGTNEDLEKLSECAKKLGLKLILDVVTNHTGDIVWYEGRTAYIPEKFTSIKNPAWLNDISNYHNVGDMNRCWSEGACIRDGDFYGLDDLATEKPVVYQGLAEIYGQWIKRYGFVGFRVDTARHVDNEFFKRWSPLINDAARSAGIKDFTIFGEVWETVPIELMNFVRTNKMQTVLDFPFQRVAVDFAASASNAKVLKNIFDYDDYYTSATSSAQNLITFLGNHDMGRVAFLIEGRKVGKANQMVDRINLAHALLYFSRGIPVVYYGDEVGMTGSQDGRDQRARQDMFATQVDIWKGEERIGAKPVGDGDSFSDKSHPISKYLTELAQVREKHPALANGQMQIRYATDSIFAFSKRENGDAREYLVLLNNSSKAQSATVPTATASKWKRIFGKGEYLATGEKVQVKMPPLSALVLRAEKAITNSKVEVTGLVAKEDFLTGFYQVTVRVKSMDLARAQFLIKNGNKWSSLGTDLSQPFNVYVDPKEFPGERQVKAIITNSKGVAFEAKEITLSIPAP